MLFYYVQINDRHDPGVNIREKASIVSISKAGCSSGEGGMGVCVCMCVWEGGEVCSETLSRDFRGQSALRKLLDPKGHLGWLIVDLNPAKIVTV